jgi:hypothetical protein
MLWCQVSLMLEIKEDDHSVQQIFAIRSTAAPKPPILVYVPSEGRMCPSLNSFIRNGDSVLVGHEYCALMINILVKLKKKMRHALTGARDSSLPCQVSSNAWVAKCSNLRAPKLGEWRSAADWINKRRVAHTSGNVANRYASNV